MGAQEFTQGAGGNCGFLILGVKWSGKIHRVDIIVIYPKYLNGMPVVNRGETWL